MKRLRNLNRVTGLFAAVLLTGAMASPCSADPSGWIAFGSSQDGDHDIWAVRSDGTGLTQLANMAGEQSWPRWSPDSTRIVYGSNSVPYGSATELWVYDWSSGTNTQVYDAHNYQGQDYGSFFISSSAWSPDGTKILFREDSAYNNPHITVINADGTGRQVVPVQSGYVSSPSWSSGGKAFAYTRRNGGPASNDLWVYDFTATGDIMAGVNSRLTEGAGSESTTRYEPDWAPSSQIALSWGHNLALIDPGLSPDWNDPANPDVTMLTSDGSYPSIRYGSPSWSPDLSYLVYGRDSGGGYDLWTMDVSTKSQSLLIALPGTQEISDWGNPNGNANPVPVPGAAVLAYIGVGTVLAGMRRRERGI